MEYFSQYESGIGQSFDLTPYRRSVSRVGLALALFCLLSMLAANGIYILVELLYPGTAPNWVSVVITVFSLYGVSLPPAYLILRGVPKDPIAPRYLPTKALLIFCFVAFTFMMAGAYFGNIVNNTIYSVLDLPVSSVVSDSLGADYFLVTCLYTLVVAPVMEEFVFRKLLIDRTRKWGLWTNVLLSGVAFGLFHGNLEQLFYATTLGFLMGYLYYQTGKLTYCILMHFLCNLFCGVLPSLVERCLTVDIYSAQTDAELMEMIMEHPLEILLYLAVSYLPLIFAFVGAILLLVNIKRLRHNGGGEKCPVPRGQRFSTAVVNVGAILFIVVNLLLIFLSLLLEILAAAVV